MLKMFKTIIIDGITFEKFDNEWESEHDAQLSQEVQDAVDSIHNITNGGSYELREDEMDEDDEVVYNYIYN